MKYKQIIAEANPSQSHWELNQLLTNLEGLEIKNVLELGIHRAGSVRVWQKVFNPKIMIGVDSADCIEGSKDFNFVLGDTHSPETRRRIEEILKGEKLDFIFIDAGHLFEEVFRDYAMYSDLVRPGGVIGFHDVILATNETTDVYKFWEGFRRNHKTVTIWDGTPAGTGEGIIYV